MLRQLSSGGRIRLRNITEPASLERTPRSEDQIALGSSRCHPYPAVSDVAAMQGRAEEGGRYLSTFSAAPGSAAFSCFPPVARSAFLAARTTFFFASSALSPSMTSRLITSLIRTSLI